MLNGAWPSAAGATVFAAATSPDRRRRHVQHSGDWPRPAVAVACLWLDANPVAERMEAPATGSRHLAVMHHGALNTAMIAQAILSPQIPSGDPHAIAGGLQKVVVDQAQSGPS
jgi:hypothetical protein